MKLQQGLATVEFAIVGTALFLILFGALEVSRALFVWNTITEATRRGARVAAICPYNHAAIKNIAIFNTPGGNAPSTILPGLTVGNVTVSYYKTDGTAAANEGETAYVAVAISGYQYTFHIPLMSLAPITLPPFTTTLPAESLGYNPTTNTRSC